MYIKNIHVNTRGNVKTKFKLMTKCSSKYLGSPLYRGATLWDNLDKDIQVLPEGVYPQSADSMRWGHRKQ